MSIGTMRHRITFIELLTEPDGIGGSNTTKVPQKSVWATVNESTGNRFNDVAALNNKQPIEVQFRTGAYAINDNTIIEYNLNELTIHSITTDSLRKITTVIAWL